MVVDVVSVACGAEGQINNSKAMLHQVAKVLFFAHFLLKHAFLILNKGGSITYFEKSL